MDFPFYFYSLSAVESLWIELLMGEGTVLLSEMVFEKLCKILKDSK